MIEEIKQSNIIEYIKKMPLEERVIINSELCNFEKSDSMYLLEQNKALVEALEKALQSMRPYDNDLPAYDILIDALITTYKGENT